MDEPFLATHGRFAQEIDELQRVHGPVQAAQEAEADTAAAPARAITALYLIALFNLLFVIHGLIGGIVAVLFAPDQLLLALCIFLAVLPALFFLRKKIDAESAQALADKAKTGHRPVDGALRWWIRGSVTPTHVRMTFMYMFIGFNSLGEAIYPVNFPEGRVAFGPLFVDSCGGLIMTTLLLLFAAVRARLKSRRCEV